MSRCVDRLLSRIAAVGAPVCVGLDPVLDRLPAEARGSTPAERVMSFCRQVIDATADVAAAFKPQSACFERFGAAGVAALDLVIEHARQARVPVILDAKRGDIGSTAEHYAAAALQLGADAVTVNGYLGPSTVVPYLAAGLGVFVLVRTSNADSGLVQSLALSTGATVAEAMAGVVRTLGLHRLGASGLSDVGAVVGLTKACESAQLRALMPEQVLLVPGYGAQGGTAHDLAPLLAGPGVPGRGVLVNASRSITYPELGGAWLRQVREAAERMRDELRAAIG
jgi:orotidine-5'-phosphate decarboxylase